MSDTFSPEQRSDIMRKVRSTKNRTTELSLIDFFKTTGIKGWRRNYPIFGKPDFVFPKYKIAVFADGCFWHGHNCRNTRPSQNADFWAAKQARNKARDELVNQTLTQKGWKVIRIWECDIKKARFHDYFDWYTR